MGKKTAITHGLFRCLLLLILYGKNNQIPVAWTDRVIEAILSMSSSGGTTLILDEPSPITGSRYVGLNLSSLDRIFRICDLRGIEIPTREKMPALVGGYHQSHVNPFSVNGNGQTIAENGLSNRARGANTMQIGDTEDD